MPRSSPAFGDGPQLDDLDRFTDAQASGATTLQAIAAELNRRGIPTATGPGEWSGKQVARVLGRL